MPKPIDELSNRYDLSREKILDILKKNKEFGYTQKELADLTGISQSNISRTLMNLMKAQKIWKRFDKKDKKGRGSQTAYYLIRDEK